MPSVSVIVPIYNVDPWLKECIDSICLQRFEDFECILVDDGSTDGCPAICDEYAASDPRFKVIHKQNGGLSSARNAGISAAVGQYIAFVDADDYILPNFLELMFAQAQKQSADIVVCGVEDVDEKGNSFKPMVISTPAKEGSFTGDQLLPQFFTEGSTYYTVAWNKLYKADLWQNLRYPEGMIYEDDATAHCLYHRSRKVVCLSRAMYKYRLRNGSICRDELRPSRFDSVSAMNMRYRYLVQQKLPKELQDKALALCWKRYLELCAMASAQSTLEIVERWQLEQIRMRTLLSPLVGCREITTKERLSCAKWAFCKLPTAK